MTLLWLALAYGIGIAVGRGLWEAGWIDCTFPSWLWLITLLLLPSTAWIERIPLFAPSAVGLRWSPRFGFKPPRNGPSPALLIALGISALTGVFRYASAPHIPCYTPDQLAYYNLPIEQAFDKRAPKVLINGYVNSYPLVKEGKQRMIVTATSLMSEGKEYPVVGDLRLSTDIRQRYHYGQPILLRGRLVTPGDIQDFAYRDYLAQRGVHSIVYDPQITVLPGRPLEGSRIKRALYWARARGERFINRTLTEPYAALANGMLLGIDAGIPQELYDSFNATGASHVIVISGSNVALVSGVLAGLGTRLFGKRRALWPVLIGIVAYALLVGGDPAVLRASLMGSLVMVAKVLDRQTSALVTLASACWVMTLLNPLAVWDVGLQLSSSATAGLILFSPSVQEGLARLWRALPFHNVALAQKNTDLPTDTQPITFRQRLADFFAGLFSEAFVATIAANISTLPLVIFYFGRLSLVTVATNLLIVPVQPLVLFPGSAGVILGIIGFQWLDLLAQGCLWVAWSAMWWTVQVVQWTASIPGASVGINGYTFGHLLVTYLVIGLIYWRHTINQPWRRWIEPSIPGWQRRRGGSLLALNSLFVCALLWWGVQSLPDGKLHVHFLDIGQGDGMLLQMPSGRQVLIDGGKDPVQLRSEIEAVLPWWDRRLDLLILTHPDSDHMAAQLNVPAWLQVTQAIETPISRAHGDSIPWRTNLAAIGTPVTLQSAGGEIELGDGVRLEILWPPAPGFRPPGLDSTIDDSVDNGYDNENGLVARLRYGRMSVLLTADIGKSSEEAMLDEGIDLSSTILKVGHHGSQHSSCPEFIAAVRPQLAIIQVGERNEYGHPHRATLERLAGLQILRNDLHGRIELVSNGDSMWIGVEKNEHAWRVGDE